MNFISGIKGDYRKIMLGRANKNIWGSRDHWPKIPGIKGAGLPLPGPQALDTGPFCLVFVFSSVIVCIFTREIISL